MQTRDVSYRNNEKIVQNVRGADTGDYSATYGGHYPSGPNRIAVYQENWSGFSSWQTWDRLDNPLEYRQYLSRGNVSDTMQLLLVRNAPQPIQSAPIAIQQYALNTQLVYNGGSDYGNG